MKRLFIKIALCVVLPLAKLSARTSRGLSQLAFRLWREAETSPATSTR